MVISIVFINYVIRKETKNLFLRYLLCMLFLRGQFDVQSFFLIETISKGQMEEKLKSICVNVCKLAVYGYKACYSSS